MSKPSIPQGTRDFDAATIQKRSYIFNTIRHCFEVFGFEPLETPAMENLETLMGKYGDEGDKLIFKILNNGLERPEKREKTTVAFEQVLQGRNSKEITERALRYDLTIPFARYVAMHHQQLTMPFKRYQLQPVWRADKPQKGRYREFYQCDADVVGSTSLQAEVDFLQLYDMVFTRLQLPVTLRLNNRKILAGLAEVCQSENLLTPITVIIDKFDKIGLAAVIDQLQQLPLSIGATEKVAAMLNISGDNDTKLQSIGKLLDGSAIGMEGVSELQQIIDFTQSIGTTNDVVLDFTLARGLNYYTGTIFEVTAKNVSIGSIGGGGRYNDLTGLFGVNDIPGAGISFGLDRIYDCLEELNLFPENALQNSKVLFLNMSDDCAPYIFTLLKRLRTNGMAADYYHQASKLDKQFKFAVKKGFTKVIIIGPDEMTEETCQVKDLQSGEQEKIAASSLLDYLQ